LTQTDFEKLRVGEVFRSRKNRVFRVSYGGKTLIAKVYPSSNTDAAREEFEILQRCSDLGLRVPRPVELVGNTIVMTCVEGVNVSEAVDHLLDESTVAEPDSVHDLAEGLADWLALFHKAFEFKFCRGDTILRNFLLSKDGIHGIDFEEAHEGDPISDIGELCASILGMRPLFGLRNMEMTSSFVDKYWKSTGEDRSSDLPESVAKALEHYARFRDDGEVLRTWSRKIRSSGMRSLEKPLSKV
jgi:tRNA A-37 threonylcarbamoyl transferase component Bud32